MAEGAEIARNIEEALKSLSKILEDGSIVIGDFTLTSEKLGKLAEFAEKGSKIGKTAMADARVILQDFGKAIMEVIPGAEKDEKAAESFQRTAEFFEKLNPSNSSAWKEFKDWIIPLIKENPGKTILGTTVLGYMISTGDLDPIHASLKVAGKDTQAAFQDVFGDHWKLVFWLIAGCFIMVFIVVLIEKTKKTVKTITNVN